MGRLKSRDFSFIFNVIKWMRTCFPDCELIMTRLVRIAAAFSMLTVCMSAATLERLGMDEMIEKSTAIVRGRVTGQRAAFRGPVIYTHFSVQVLERWKGVESAQVEVAVPGGAARGLTPGHTTAR